MIDLMLPEISSVAGDASDGVIRGRVNQSLLTGLFSNVLLAGTLYAIRRDRSAGGTAYLDVSSLAISGTTDALEPFGSTAVMSAGDGLLIACEHDIKEIYVNVTTAGAGSWDGIELYDSSDGKKFNRLLANIVDGTNGFKATGIGRITFDHPSTTHQTFSPAPDDIAERKWLLIAPKNITSVTTAPKVSRIWIIHHDESITYNEYTSTINASLTSGDFTGYPSTVFPVIGTERLYIFPFLAYGMDVTIHRKSPGTTTLAAEYLASDGTWKSIPGWNDPSNGFQNGPTTLGGATTSHMIRWSVPSDWVSKTSNLAMSDGSTKSVTGYFIRLRVTAVSPLGPIAPTLYRGRVRAFGSANCSGIKAYTARTLNGLTVSRAGVPNTAATTINLINGHTGQGASVTIPANPSLPWSAEISPNLPLAAGQELLIVHTSGGTLRDVNVHIQS